MGKKNPEKMTKDDRYHDKVKMFVEQAMQLIMMIVDYEIESSGKGKWIGMIDLANEAIKRVEVWQVLIKSAEALQKEKEELQSFGKDVLQQMAILNQKGQSISEARSEIMAYKTFLKKTEDFFLKITKNDNLNQGCAHQVEGHHAVDAGGEQLTLESAQIPPSSQSNEKGKDVEVRDREGSQNLADDIFAEILGSDLLDLPYPWGVSVEELENYRDKLGMNIFPGTNGDVGTSNAAANKANVKLSPEETSKFEGIKVFKRNFDLLNEIQKEHPDTFDTFKREHLLSKSTILNILAEVFQNVRNEVMLEQKDIEILKLLVQAMGHTGLQLTWLGDMLENVHRKLLQERIQRRRTLLKEDEMELARLEKKPRFQ